MHTEHSAAYDRLVKVNGDRRFPTSMHRCSLSALAFSANVSSALMVLVRRVALRAPFDFRADRVSLDVRCRLLINSGSAVLIINMSHVGVIRHCPGSGRAPPRSRSHSE